MTTDAAEKLLVEGVQELYYAEQQLVDATETLAEQTSDESASQAFSEHHDETQTHVNRLEDVFEELGEEPQTKEEQVVDALIDEHEQFAQENDGETLDRYNIAAGQKTEHYEIAAYGNVTSLADKLGHQEAADLLEENLREEQSARDELSQVGEQFDEQYVASD
jgi:ferritin-like metal-binding protein YciE